MSEVRASSVTRGVSAVLPGLPQLLAGRVLSGALALSVWLLHVSVLVLSRGSLREAVAGGWDDKLAVATLFGGLALSWLWSWTDVSRSPAEDGAGVSQWRLAVRTFARNRTAVAGLVALAALYLVAAMTPLIADFDPLAQADDLVSGRYQPFGSVHLLGTDEYGRDVLSRLLYGARVSLSIGILAMGIAVTLGTLVGSVAGYVGGVVDAALMRFVDMVISFPRLVLLITIVAVFEPSYLLLVTVLGLTMWPSTARLVRGEVLTLREREFVQAAESLGYSKRRIVLRHLIPNALAPVIVAATLGVGNTIVLEAGLSYLGLGVQGVPSWGTMVADGKEVLLNAWWVATLPGLAIVFTVLSFNLVGDGLRDALDPRLRA